MTLARGAARGAAAPACHCTQMAPPLPYTSRCSTSGRSAAATRPSHTIQLTALRLSMTGALVASLHGHHSAAPITVCRSSSGGNGGSGDDDYPPLDIEALASQLSREAAKLRASMGGSVDGDDLAAPSAYTDEDAAPDAAALFSRGLPNPSDRPLERFGRLRPKEAENAILRALRDGGFNSTEFELLQQIGKLSVQQVCYINLLTIFVF